MYSGIVGYVVVVLLRIDLKQSNMRPSIAAVSERTCGPRLSAQANPHSRLS